MHICHVNLAKGFSGGERQTLNLIRTLSQAGVRQSAVVRADSPLNQELAGLDIDVTHVNHNLLGHLRAHRIKADLLHAHDGKAVYWCALQNMFRGSQYIITRRVDNPLKDKPLTRKAYLNARRVVCLSRAIESAVHKLSASIKTTRIPSSCSRFDVDSAKVATIRQKFTGKYLVGQAGKLIHHKGFHVTIEAARKLAKQAPEIHFILLGRGEMETELKSQATGLKNVSFLGHQADIGNYLAAMDLMVFPSLSEGLGSTILEAWQQGTPVVGSNAGGIPDMIENNKTGLLIPPGDHRALGDAVTKLIQEPELVQRIRGEASARLQHFTPDAVAGRYLKLYRSLLVELPTQ